MIKLPDFKELAEPSELKIINFKNSTLFLVSFFIEIANIVFSLIGFKNLDIQIKIIIILSITCAILLADIILLYIKDRENYFNNVYITNMYRLLTDNVRNLQSSTATLSKDIDDINSKINKN